MLKRNMGRKRRRKERPENRKRTCCNMRRWKAAERERGKKRSTCVKKKNRCKEDGHYQDVSAVLFIGFNN